MTFDLWHTLVYLEPDAEERYMQRQEALAVSLLADGLSADDGAARVRGAWLRERQRAIRSAERGRSVPVQHQFDRAAHSLRSSARSSDYLAAMRAEVERTPFLRAPYALATLRRLRERGWRIGVISNTVGEPGAFLRPLLNRMRIRPLVDTCVFSDELPWTKPSPAIFHDALRRLHASPRQTVHVGDGWSDVEGARRARLRAGILYTGLRRYGPSYRKQFAGPHRLRVAPENTVARLDRLPAVVERLMSDGEAPR
ncbi:MAG TPA: HAD family hydrolase [Thermoplasmata archaeon]|nr:HAD family hydrolase [Thermoplasmata archaeon]